jgi:hypothetical protein
VEEVKYEPYFSGSFEYFVLNWTGSAKTIEFNFRFDPAKTSESGTVFILANCSDNWVVGAVRDRGNDWGKLFFSIDKLNFATLFGIVTYIIYICPAPLPFNLAGTNPTYGTQKLTILVNYI